MIEMNKLPIVHLMRGGAPDKIGLWTDGSYQLLRHDHTNLVSWTESEIQSYLDKGEYLLPADEGDILHVNKLNLTKEYQILLPQTIGGKVIKFDDYVPKHSLIYKRIAAGSLPGVTYMPYTIFPSYADDTIWTFVQRANKGERKLALKSTSGSGSRGVWLIDPDRVHLGGKYVNKLENSTFKEFIQYCKDNNALVMLQELIPNDPLLTKVNVDFVIREGKLLGYKWDKTDPSAVFTNWNFGWFTTTEYTDMIMNNIAEFLVDNGIYNAIMNFEAFTDYSKNLYLIEFNWRYSNSMFEGQAEQIDLIGKYLREEEFRFPYESRKFVRYWQCNYYDELIK